MAPQSPRRVPRAVDHDYERGTERAETDAGRLGDKVDHPDPAAAPMHSDAEAAGTPTSARAVDESIAERKRTAGTAAAHEPGFGREQQQRAPDAGKSGRTLGIILVAAAILIVVVAAVMLS